jgi:aminoglycoside 6'-N-acetyltransferase I
MIEIKPATNSDLNQWAKLRYLLWSDLSIDGHNLEIQSELAHPDKECLLAWQDDQAVGFIELTLRSVVDGCLSTPVAYMEGWFVLEEFRAQNIGKKLVQSAEAWAQSRGCSEMGSDAEIDNQVSIASHKALGFEEVDRVVQFRKSLQHS